MRRADLKSIDDETRPEPSLWRLWSVIIAGEAIFVLPFVLPRLFRPTMLDVWGITNYQLGLAFSAYGVVAMVSYLFGGLLADRFDPRKLMTAALLATAAISLAMLGLPTARGLLSIYALFGLTTILMFWSSMIRVTHTLGGDDSQGTAFGVLDAGRGLFAALLASVLFAVFTWVRGDAAAGSPDGSVATGAVALRAIIIIAATVVVGSAISLYLSLRDLSPPDRQQNSEKINWNHFVRVAMRPSIWLQGVIVLCAYCGYKSIDNFGIYATDAFEFTDVDAARLTTIVFWARPVAAFAAGFIADRTGHFGMLILLFLATAIGNVLLAVAEPLGLAGFGLFVTFTSAAAAVYGMRGVYFAVFDDLRVPPAYVGTAAGIISMIGFLPDVFFGSITGYVIDSNPGAIGHQIVFVSVSVLALFGMAAALVNRRISMQPLN